MSTEATPAADVTTTPAATTETTTTTTETPKVETATTTTETTETPATPTEPAKTGDEPAKPAEPAKADEPAKPAEPVKSEPPKYELKGSEGSMLTAEQVKEVETIAKSANLSEEQAKQVLTSQEAAVKAHNDLLVKRHNDQVKQWVDSIKVDKDMGGANLELTLEQSAKASKFFADEGFIKELEQSGFGNHPGFVKMMAKIGAAMGENTAFHKPTTVTQPTKKTAAEILFGKTSGQ